MTKEKLPQEETKVEAAAEAPQEPTSILKEKSSSNTATFAILSVLVLSAAGAWAVSDFVRNTQITVKEAHTTVQEAAALTETVTEDIANGYEAAKEDASVFVEETLPEILNEIEPGTETVDLTEEAPEIAPEATPVEFSSSAEKFGPPTADEAAAAADATKAVTQ